jgi:hypothetical protein
MKNIVNLDIYFIHCLCDDIIMTSIFATNVACDLFNATMNHFSCECHLRLKFSPKLKLKICNFVLVCSRPRFIKLGILLLCLNVCHLHMY